MTEGGVVFIGAAMDNYLRAFDADTGEELWKGRLPAGGQATPMTYRLAENGRQFVVVAAGGHGRLGTDIGDSVVAFALPDSRADMLAQAAVQALRILAAIAIVLALLPLVTLWRKNWFWFPLLILLILMATWTAWLVTQTAVPTLLVMFAAIATAWLLTVTRNRVRPATPRAMSR